MRVGEQFACDRGGFVLLLDILEARGICAYSVAAGRAWPSRSASMLRYSCMQRRVQLVSPQSHGLRGSAGFVISHTETK